MIRNPNYAESNFLVPEFDVSWPFYTVESDYLTAGLCLLLSLVFFTLAWKKEQIRPVWRKVILWTFAVISMFAYTNFFTFHGPDEKGGKRIAQTWDMFHYLIGSRYQNELGYSHFYDACLLALREIEPESEDHDFWTLLSYRDMRTYQILPGTAALLQRDSIQSTFSDTRWQQFVRDVQVFYNKLGPEYFRKAMHDHGYNPPPTYALVARILIGDGEWSDTRLALLALVDWVLLTLTFVLIARGFGIEAALVSTILFAVAYLSNFSWVGNSFLRFGWFTAIAGALVFQKSKNYVLSGLFLGIASGLRVFPGFLLVSLGFPFLWQWWKVIRQKKGNRELTHTLDLLAWRDSPVCIRLLKTVTSAASLLLLWVLLSFIGSERSSLWSEWTATISLHKDRLSANHASLRAAVAIDPELTSGILLAEDVDAAWNEGKKAVLEKRVWIFLPLIGAFVVIALAGAARLEPYNYLLIGLSSLFFFLNLSGYYLVFIALFPLFFINRRIGSFDLGFTLAAILALLTLSQYLTQQAYLHLDWVYAVSSVTLTVVLLVVPLLHVFLEGRELEP